MGDNLNRSYSDNFPFDNVWYTEVDSIGIGPSLNWEVKGTGYLIAVCHPDIHVPVVAGKKSPVYVCINGLKRHQMNMEESTETFAEEDTLMSPDKEYYEYYVRVGLCSDEDTDTNAVVTFVNTLDDLKDIAPNVRYRLRDDAEFKRSCLTEPMMPFYSKILPKNGYYNKIFFSQVKYTQKEDTI